MPLDRTWYNTLVDDSGGGTNGTVWDKAAVDALMDDIDTALAAITSSNSFADDLIFTANKVLRRNTSDGSDNGTVEVNGGGATGATRGGALVVAGNEHATKPGYVDLQIGNIASALARILRSDGTASLTVNGSTGVVTAAHGLTSTSTLTASALIDASGASAGQIQFPASQNASANANTLDDYEEGVFTPVLGGEGGTSGQSYTTQAGAYVKIGKFVLAYFSVTLSTKGTLTGAIEIQQLPFAVASFATMTIPYFNNLAAAWIFIGGRVNTSTSMTLQGAKSAAVTTMDSMATADIGNTTRMDGFCVYQATA